MIETRLVADAPAWTTLASSRRNDRAPSILVVTPLGSGSFTFYD